MEDHSGPRSHSLRRVKMISIKIYFCQKRVMNKNKYSAPEQRQSERSWSVKITEISLEKLLSSFCGSKKLNLHDFGTNVHT